jgi:hypothetical protein
MATYISCSIILIANEEIANLTTSFQNSKYLKIPYTPLAEIIPSISRATSKFAFAIWE